MIELLPLIEAKLSQELEENKNNISLVMKLTRRALFLSNSNEVPTMGTTGTFVVCSNCSTANLCEAQKQCLDYEHTS